MGTFCNLCCKKLLLLTILVTLVEFVNTAGGINELNLTGVERVRGVRDLDLYDRIFNAVNFKGLLGGCARACDEYGVV